MPFEIGKKVSIGIYNGEITDYWDDFVRVKLDNGQVLKMDPRLVEAPKKSTRQKKDKPEE